MDRFYQALVFFRKRKFQECIEICSELLETNPNDLGFWTLKLRAMTSQVYIDDVEADEEGVAEMLLDDNSIATAARPGTTLRSENKSPSQSIRPMTHSGRPITGVLRPGTSRVPTMENALSIPRTAKSSRPMTTSSGRFVRIGTSSMLSQPDGPFVNLSRLNISKYANMPGVAKPLFEYILYHENDVRHALDLAAKVNNPDWYWKLALGKCYYKVGMLRDSEIQFKLAIKEPEVSVDSYLWLGKVFIRLDQPLAALEIYKQGLERFPQETLLLIYSARVQEILSMDEAVRIYKEVLFKEAINVEAIACIAMHHFYNDQPEIALRYYRRILQMGTNNAEVYNNLALCCYYSQQFDMVITCFEKALIHSTDDDTTADIWFNIAHVAICAGDRHLAVQCLRLALAANNQHYEAYNNLGVIEMIKAAATTQNLQQAKSFFQAASSSKHLYEPFFNLAMIGEKLGNYDFCYQNVKMSLKIYPEHYASKDMFKRIKKMYETV